MVVINVLFQGMNRSYDFKVDENAKTAKVIEDMAMMIAQREHLNFDKNKESFVLCDLDRQLILNMDSTFAENGICSGKTLVML
ncbi:MAG: hypothetical protein MJ116_02610 [Lachnospiraceae bacterium]|nr:hypothetical protein [Lachnospiraceae bacterium]